MTIKFAAMPARIERLPRDARGYPVPQAVSRDADGKPRIAIIDPARAAALHKTHSCGICGEKLLRSEKWFVGSFGSFRHGGFADPPMHGECVAFAMRVCPYLSAPVYLKKISRPDVFVALMTSSYRYRERFYPHNKDGRTPGRYPVYYAQRPWLRATWWRAGREITDLSEILQIHGEGDRDIVSRFLGLSQEAR